MENERTIDDILEYISNDPDWAFEDEETKAYTLESLPWTLVEM